LPLASLIIKAAFFLASLISLEALFFSSAFEIIKPIISPKITAHTKNII
jgi:hypothetical protein